jgi:hypothetical protein
MEHLPEIKPSLLERQKRRDKRMHRITAEYGRHKGGDKGKKIRQAGERKYRQKENLTDNHAVREPMRQMARSHSNPFPDLNTGAFKRWLRNQLGRPWNDVFSEISNFTRNQSVYAHLLHEQVYYLVSMHNFQDEAGKWFYTDCFGSIKKVTPFTCFRQPFYVHPETGLLERWPHPSEAKGEQLSKREKLRREKQETRRKIRLGIPIHQEPQPKGINIEGFPLRIRNKRIWKGLTLDVQQGEHIFRAEILKHEIDWGDFSVLLADNHTLHQSESRLRLRLRVVRHCHGLQYLNGQILYLEMLENEPTPWLICEVGRLF